MHQGLIMAELLHFLSFLALYVQIQKNKNCQGISYKTQELYLVVFITREHRDNYEDYLSSLYNEIDPHNENTKTYMFGKQLVQFQTYTIENDSFPHVYIYPITVILTIIFHTGWSIINLSQSFSMWLEVFAIIPQLDLMRRLKEAENLTGYYVFLLGIYRLLYIISWICKYLHSGWWCWTSILTGLASSAIYGDFLYYFIKNRGQFKVNV